MIKILFIDRDGTIIKEAPPTYQIDSFDKLEFYPELFTWLSRITNELDYQLVMVTNQDGLGTASFPEETFWPVQNFVLKTLENEGIIFSNIHIDQSFAAENVPTRKPGTGMLTAYLNNPDYDIPGSFVIGDRITDVQLAKNLGAKAIWLNTDASLGAVELNNEPSDLQSIIVLETTKWKSIYEYLRLGQRVVQQERNTNETKIKVTLNLDGQGNAKIDTGLIFLIICWNNLAGIVALI